LIEILYKPIGIIHTPYKEKSSTPIQSVLSPDSEGEIEIFPEYAAGLQDIEGFSHLILLYHFHCSEGYSLLSKPFLDKEKKGIFATRYCDRPNSIGLSIVRLLKVKGNILKIVDVDMLDDTPLLDIKPYVPEFDIRQNVKDGWYQRASERNKYISTKAPCPSNRG
jgi:tRNA-Thr(GGU) m(6)t(6)A37 methyltransferase TsaA